MKTAEIKKNKAKAAAEAAAATLTAKKAMRDAQLAQESQDDFEHAPAKKARTEGALAKDSDTEAAAAAAATATPIGGSSLGDMAKKIIGR